MAFTHNPSKLLTAWMLFSSIIVLWDAGYILLRPYSLPTSTSPLRYIWYPYQHYYLVDYNYGVLAYEAGDGFPAAQSVMNVIESFLNLSYLFLLYGVGGAPTVKQKGQREALACIVGLVSTVMTESKTLLYWLVEVFGGWSGAAEKLWSLPFSTLFWFWLLPNGFWVTMPAWCAYQFAKDLIRGVGGDGKGEIVAKKVK